MPFWAGELTEDQHPHPDLVQAMRQASWDLYFRDNPVCEPPAFVQDPGIDLDSILGGQPLRIMHRESSRSGGRGQTTSSSIVGAEAGAFDHVKAFRRKTNQSWVNIYKGARFLQNKEHKPFNSKNTESSAKSCVRKICKEVDLSYAEIEELLVEHGLGRVDIQVFRPSDRHFGRQIPQIGTKSPILHKLSQMWLSAPL